MTRRAKAAERRELRKEESRSMALEGKMSQEITVWMRRKMKRGDTRLVRTEPRSGEGNLRGGQLCACLRNTQKEGRLGDTRRSETHTLW